FRSMRGRSMTGARRNSEVEDTLAYASPIPAMASPPSASRTCRLSMRADREKGLVYSRSMLTGRISASPSACSMRGLANQGRTEAEQGVQRHQPDQPDGRPARSPVRDGGAKALPNRTEGRHGAPSLAADARFGGARRCQR